MTLKKYFENGKIKILKLTTWTTSMKITAHFQYVKYPKIKVSNEYYKWWTIKNINPKLGL